MSDTKFTPGPWDDSDGLSIKVRGRGSIATIPNPQNGGVMECVANARLIAAAPELYEACEQMLRCLRLSVMSFPDAEAAADKALAKARGEN